MVDWLSVLVECANSVREAVLRLYGTAEGGERLGLGAGGDLTLKMDRLAEDTAVEKLLERDLSFTLLSEEAGVRRFGAEPEEAYVILDPLDGSLNASRGLPFAATALAYSKNLFLESVEEAVVIDIVHGTTYTASRGHGAFKDGEPIEPSSRESLKGILLGVDLCKYGDLASFSKLMPILKEVRHVRHLGANALELCYVSDGTIDAFIDPAGRVRVLDLASPYLIVTEAGGVVTDSEGRSLRSPITTSEKVSIIASGNKMLHKAILEKVG